MPKVNSSWSLYPEGPLAPTPDPNAPPQGLFEQLVFLNASHFPVNAVRYRLNGGVSTDVLAADLLPGGVVHHPDGSSPTAKSIDMELEVNGVAFYMYTHAVQEAGMHIYRATAGVSAHSEDTEWRPFCALLLRDDTADKATPGEVVIELVPAYRWHGQPPGVMAAD